VIKLDHHEATRRSALQIMRLTAAIARYGDWFVAQCLGVDVASQGTSLEEARDNLAEARALYLILEDEDVQVGECPVIVPIGLAV
jgi:predicted RNase H-like HicB family nuclease